MSAISGVAAHLESENVERDAVGSVYAVGSCVSPNHKVKAVWAAAYDGLLCRVHGGPDGSGQPSDEEARADSIDIKQR